MASWRVHATYYSIFSCKTEPVNRKELRDTPPVVTGTNACKEGTVWDGMERVSLDHEMIEYLFEYRGKDASAAARDSKQGPNSIEKNWL